MEKMKRYLSAMVVCLMTLFLTACVQRSDLVDSESTLNEPVDFDGITEITISLSEEESDMVNGKYALNSPEADVVQKIFADYIGGKSLKTIAAEMQIPYNIGKNIWNINMVCRVLENTKYLGNDKFPRIVSNEDFENVARIKSERNTYRKPTLQDEPQRTETRITEYQPTEEIQRITNEINRLLVSDSADKSMVEELIIKCTQLKYTTIKEVIT